MMSIAIVCDVYHDNCCSYDGDFEKTIGIVLTTFDDIDRGILLIKRGPKY